MPHESERLRGEKALRDLERSVMYQGQRWLIVEFLEEGRAVRMVSWDGKREKVVGVSEVQTTAI